MRLKSSKILYYTLPANFCCTPTVAIIDAGIPIRITAGQQQMGSTLYTYRPRNRFAIVSVKKKLVGSTRLGEVDRAKQMPLRTRSAPLSSVYK